MTENEQSRQESYKTCIKTEWKQEIQARWTEKERKWV